MRTDDDTLLVNACLDGELCLQSRLIFEERLRTDPRLRAQLESLRSMSRSLREDAGYHRAPDDLRLGVARMGAADAAPQPRRTLLTRESWISRLFPFKPLAAAAFATIGAVAVNVSLLRTEDVNRSRDELVASHVRATLSQRTIDVASSDQHTVKPWFAGRLDFAPPVHELSRLPGGVLVGGRVDYVQGRKVAVLVYEYRKHVVDHYIWPAGSRESGPSTAVARGFRLVQWTQGGMAHRIVSDLNDEELQMLVQACREALKG